MKLEYFEDTDGLEKLIADYKDVFEMIEDYGTQLRSGVAYTADDYKECLDKLTGAFISLEPLYAVAEAVKLNQETQAYVSMKKALEDKGEKVVAASLEKESSLSVAPYRRVRAILEGYVEACSKGIGTCQTQLKRLETEYKNKNSKLNE
jgi:hypothetical protein